MKIKLNNGKLVEKYTVADLPAEINWAKSTALKKANHTADTWQGRSPHKRFENIFLGDLAKNIVKKYLLQEIAGVSPFLIEYDQIRTDDFINRDMFDLKIEKDATSIELEIKSSGEKTISDPSSLNSSRRLIVNQPGPHYHLSDACIQVMFVPANMQFFKNEITASQLSLEKYSEGYIQDFAAASVIAYIMGFADLQMQKNALANLFSVNNSGAGANRRSYADLILSNTHQIDSLTQAIKKKISL